MNNKGVTLIELLIVIVVIGIISAFAVPAVGQFLDNAEKTAVLQDAIAIRNGAENYCATEGCTDTETLSWGDLKSYVSSFSEANYTQTDGTDDTVTIATRATDGSWDVVLESDTVGEWEWPASNTVDPIEGTIKDDVKAAQ